MPINVPSPRQRSVDEAIRQIVGAIRALADGRSNATGAVTLAPGATSTTVSDARVGPESVILLSPMSASAVSQDSHVHVAAVTRGGFTLAHDANPAADRRFRYAIQG